MIFLAPAQVRPLLSTPLLSPLSTPLPSPLLPLPFSPPSSTPHTHRLTLHTQKSQTLIPNLTGETSGREEHLKTTLLGLTPRWLRLLAPLLPVTCMCVCVCVCVGYWEVCGGVCVCVCAVWCVGGVWWMWCVCGCVVASFSGVFVWRCGECGGVVCGIVCMCV